MKPMNGNTKWTEETTRQEALKYKSRKKFSKGSPGAYAAACKNDWLKSYPWLVRLRKQWTEETVRQEALKYNTRGEFMRRSSGAYEVARKNDWLKTYTWLVPVRKQWSKESVLKVALKCESRTQFREENPGAYKAAVANGWHEVFELLKVNQIQHRFGYWTDERIRQEALKYKFKKEFEKGSPKAYAAARRKHLLETFDWFEAKTKPSGYWNVYENNREEALKYKTRTEFQNGCQSAYHAACINGWLETYDWFVTTRKPVGYWDVYVNNRKEALKYRLVSDFQRGNSSAYDAARKHNWFETYDWFEKNMYSPGYTLSLLKSGDLDGMSRHQLLELIMNGKLPRALKVLIYTKPNSVRSRNVIRNLIDLYENQHTEAENKAAIENMEQEERQAFEEETKRQAVNNGFLSLDTDCTTNEPVENQKDEVQQAQNAQMLPTYVASTFLVNDKTIKVNPSEKGSEFMVKEDNSKLWNSMLYANEEGLALSEYKKLKSMECGDFSGYVRDKFIYEFDIVYAIKEDHDYRFDLAGKPCPPSLMQKLMAYKMSTNDCYGNWCGTGAGKTNAFLFSTRYVGAKTNVVITPNSVIGSFVKAIGRIYPNSDVVVPKCPEDIKPYSKDRYTYIIFNYEKFQEPARAKEYINRLLDTNTIDFVCLDEVQNIKVRNVKYASNRSKYISMFLVKAREQRPGMKTLAMSATPCPNCLAEVRSILEALTGKKYPEIGNQKNVPNIHNAYKALVLNGFRYVPKYPMVLNERTVEVDCTSDTDLYAELCNRDNDMNDIDYILAKRKLGILKDEIKDGTIVYSNWVDGMAEFLENSIRSWGYSVECYNGKSGGKEEREEIKEAFINKKINVLVCSQPISTGVDGLQTRSNKLIYVSLPWTYDDKTQTDGRLYRQGSAFKSIDVVIPQVTITRPDGSVWSWDKGRLDDIENKRSLSASVLDGYLQDSKRLSRERLMKLALEALKLGFEENTDERQDIELEVGLEETEEQRKVRRQNYVSEVHRRGNSSNHNTMHRYFNEHPDVFNTYHDSRDTEELAKKTVVPVADFINSHYTGKKIADLGCGVNMLSTLVKNGNTVTGFDHQRYKGHDEVVIADIGNLNGIVKDEEMDIAVFCLSLWAQDYEDYFNEAFRILSKNGVMFVVEPTSDFGENERFGTEEDFTDMVEGYGFSRLGKVKKHHGFAFFRFEKE